MNAEKKVDEEHRQGGAFDVGSQGYGGVENVTGREEAEQQAPDPGRPAADEPVEDQKSGQGKEQAEEKRAHSQRHDGRTEQQEERHRQDRDAQRPAPEVVDLVVLEGQQEAFDEIPGAVSPQELLAAFRSDGRFVEVGPGYDDDEEAKEQCNEKKNSQGAPGAPVIPASRERRGCN
jgi:hypothetical protein